MIKARVIGGRASSDPAVAYTRLLCTVTLQAMRDAQRNYSTWQPSALLYLNSSTVRGLHDLAGVPMPDGEWTPERLRQFKYRRKP